MKKQSLFTLLLVSTLSLGISSCSTSEPVEDMSIDLESTLDPDDDPNGDGDTDRDRPGSGVVGG